MTFQRALTEAEMTELCTIGNGPETVVRFFRIAGVDLADGSVETVDPRHFIIPAEQWRTICESIHVDGMGDLGGQLTWMNVGPSSVDDGGSK